MVTIDELRSTPTRVGKTLLFRLDSFGVHGPPPRVWGKRQGEMAEIDQ